MDLTEKLRSREPFAMGALTGAPTDNFMASPAGEKWKQGSMARVFAGALNERGTAGVIGGGRLPDIGELDIAPAMAMALFEATYVVRSYDTPIAWYLGPEVYGAGDGEWIEVAERCNREYGRFSRTTTKHQNMVHAALEAAK